MATLLDFLEDKQAKKDGYEVRSVVPEGLRRKNNKAPKK